jgi:NAD(P)-dependent dehydrogenase (short-subunit alcohol dehydrogenase family)
MPWAPRLAQWGVLFSIEGKTALVTGGSRGIGKMIATGFVEAGARVYIAARKHAASLETAAELSKVGECIAFEADLSTEEGCRGLAAEIASRESKLEILVNNAGATWAAPIEEFGDAAWDRGLDVNLKGVFFMTRFLLPELRAAATAEDPARVINIGSIDGLRPPPQNTFSYSTSKAAVHMLTRHLAAKLAPDITVNAIAPGPFESKMMAETLRNFGDQITAEAPLKRIGRPDDLAGTAIFLASRAGSYLTGAVIPVDGGISTV